MEAQACLLDVREPTGLILARHGSTFQLPREPMRFFLMSQAILFGQLPQKIMLIVHLW